MVLWQLNSSRAVRRSVYSAPYGGTEYQPPCPWGNYSTGLNRLIPLVRETSKAPTSAVGQCLNFLFQLAGVWGSVSEKVIPTQIRASGESGGVEVYVVYKEKEGES
jgi:hypothetical protein